MQWLSVRPMPSSTKRFAPWPMLAAALQRSAMLRSNTSRERREIVGRSGVNLRKVSCQNYGLCCCRCCLWQMVSPVGALHGRHEDRVQGSRAPDRRLGLLCYRSLQLSGVTYVLVVGSKAPCLQKARIGTAKGRRGER